MLPGKDHFIKEAQDQTGLIDFGDPWMLDHIDPLVKALNATAKLGPEGAYGANLMISGALSNRLRLIQLLKDYPEILDEQVEVAAVLSGLPRTGSTMLHRMLASAPELTAMRWYETQNYLPLPGEDKGDPSPRIAAAEGILAYMLEKIPELMSIHPMSTTQPDEEVIVMGQLFSSSMIESTYFVPEFAAFLDSQDPMPAYHDLITILKCLQWQDEKRVGKKWVLKTPGHLSTMATALKAFPEAKFITTHRDPVATVPSYCSMEASLYKLGSREISNEDIGRFWAPRLKFWLDNYMSARKREGAGRFMDIHYKRLLENPTELGAEVLEFAGIPMSAAIKTGMAEWIEANRREHRAPHQYTLDDFGLSAETIEAEFAVYRDSFVK
ncbi:MAG: sulfotransferase [Hellea sp.]|nr:sulfotransferase [Hellea sp.]